jgi:hypothetical protein
MAGSQDPLDALAGFAKAWAGIAALATVTVYALGYLSLRSRHSAFGIDVDLGVFDDRYPFAGARFLAFILAYSASLALPLLVIAVVWRGVRRVRGRLALSSPTWPGGVLRLVLVGLLAFATVTFLKVLLIHDLLLDQRRPDDWAAAKLVCWLATDPDIEREGVNPERSGELSEPTTEGPADAPGRTASASDYLALSFILLMVLTGLTIAWAWHEGRQPGPARRGLASLLWLLAAVGLMLLPVYHGTFFADTIVRRLDAAPAGVAALAGDVWLVYRGNEKAVLFARDPARDPRLITVDAALLNGLAIVGVAHIGKLLEIKECSK